MPADDNKTPAPERRFWDSLWALALLIGAVLLARAYVLEPFKIPSGSMEPTLFGHEDYGDRILTNKLAYVSGLVVLAAGAVALLTILGSLAWSILYSGVHELRQHRRAILVTSALAIVTVGGLGLSFARDAVAGNPHRFDVVVFQYNSGWNPGDGKSPQNINYIKRLVGLPGESVMISGGNLFLKNSATGKYEIIRKWKEGGPELQERLWYPVSLAWHGVYSGWPKDNSAKKPAPAQPPEADTPAEAAEREWRKKLNDTVEAELNDLAFPWAGAEPGEPGVKRLPKALELDGTATVQLTYKYPVTNIYLKQGRWPFRHVDCPAAHMPSLAGPDGILLRNPKSTPEEMTAYVGSTWEGVQCPHCKEVAFPVSLNSRQAPRLVPEGPTPFYYGGNFIVGELRLDVTLDIEKSDALQLEAGSSLHSALWKIPSSGAEADSATVHPVKAPVAELQPGRHTLSLQYVDATVIAVLDGREIERREIDGIGPQTGDEYRHMESLARITFFGVKGVVSRLDLSRDLFHTPGIPDGRNPSVFSVSPHDPWPDRYYEPKNSVAEFPNYVANIPPDKYLMLGDNSPSSSDGRVWGFVPKERLVGRAWVVWWPPSRWRLVK